MEDLFKEQLVKKEESKKDLFKRACIVSAACVLALIMFILFKGIPSTPLIIVIAIGAVYLIGRTNIEFEYIYTNGTLDIDCIYNKSKRKNVFSAEVYDFEIMAHINDETHLNEYKNLPIKDFSSGGIYGNTYVFVTYFKGQKMRIIFEPNKEIVDAMYIIMTPKKLFKKQ